MPKSFVHQPLLLAFFIILGSWGCETDPSEQIAVNITPNNAELKVGQSQTFTASGWQDYTWSLEDKTLGVLSSTKGDTTVYTAISAPTNGIIQTLSLSVDLGVETASNTNGPGQVKTVSAQALITQSP